MNTIEKVVVDPYCYLCKPSFHKITIYYTNAKTTTEILGDSSIVEKYWNYMSFESQRHFFYLFPK